MTSNLDAIKLNLNYTLESHLLTVDDNLSKKHFILLFVTKQKLQFFGIFEKQ